MIFESKDSLEIFTKYDIAESVAIEGFHIDRDKLEIIMQKGPSNNDEVMFYRAYDIALEYYIKSNEGKINKINMKLINDINKGVGYDGFLRKVNVRVGSYIPPKYEEINLLMKKYIKYINSSKLDVSTQHILFEGIHPYRDGNGRTGRILNNIILLSHNMFPVVVEERRRYEYYNALNTFKELKIENIDSTKMNLVLSGNTIPF